MAMHASPTLVMLAIRTYQDAPPIPERVAGPTGDTIFTRADIQAGQQVFLKYGLMENGTIWGHGAYLGPDFSAEYLHTLTEDAQETIANQLYHRLGSERGAVTRRQGHPGDALQHGPHAGESTWTPVSARMRSERACTPARCSSECEAPLRDSRLKRGAAHLPWRIIRITLRGCAPAHPAAPSTAPRSRDPSHRQTAAAPPDHARVPATPRPTPTWPAIRA